MGAVLTRRLLAAATIFTMIACGFVFSTSQSCLADSGDSGFICTAEALSAPTTWMASANHMAIQAKELFTVAIVVFTAAILITQGRRWQPPHTSLWIERRAPIPNHTFIPHLSASHGG